MVTPASNAAKIEGNKKELSKVKKAMGILSKLALKRKKGMSTKAEDGKLKGLIKTYGPIFLMILTAIGGLGYGLKKDREIAKRKMKELEMANPSAYHTGVDATIQKGYGKKYFGLANDYSKPIYVTNPATEGLTQLSDGRYYDTSQFGNQDWKSQSMLRDKFKKHYDGSYHDRAMDYVDRGDAYLNRAYEDGRERSKSAFRKASDWVNKKLGRSSQRRRASSQRRKRNKYSRRRNSRRNSRRR
tara:strand:+ start:5905 stop:6633 length:729 start_codon:yes stop_codon:yes gene_type:complete